MGCVGCCTSPGHRGFRPQHHDCLVGSTTHQPNCWTSKVFVETRTRSGTNLFGVFSCVGGWSRVNVVCSDSTCKVWGGWLSAVWATGLSDWLCASCMIILIGSVLVNKCGVWEGWNTVCSLFSMHSVPSFPVVAPPTYCISCKCRAYPLLWSWQHVEAVCSMQLFCQTAQTRGNRVVGKRQLVWVWAVCGGLNRHRPWTMPTEDPCNLPTMDRSTYWGPGTNTLWWTSSTSRSMSQTSSPGIGPTCGAGPAPAEVAPATLPHIAVRPPRFPQNLFYRAVMELPSNMLMLSFYS